MAILRIQLPAHKSLGDKHLKLQQKVEQEQDIMKEGQGEQLELEVQLLK